MKYGIFGGAFNPPHSEHLKIIEECRESLELDYIILVPSYNPPHKNKEMTDFNHRCNMLALLAKDKPYILIDRTEEELKLSDSYACLVIPEIKRKYVGEHVYIMGGDSLVHLNTWKNPELIAKEVGFAVFARKNYKKTDAAMDYAVNVLGADVKYFDVKLDDVSSSELRARLALCDNTERYLDKRVLAYIKNNGLYAENPAFSEKIKKYQSAELFEHSVRTTVYAMRFLSKLNLSYQDVFTAAMLHDIAKEQKTENTYGDTPLKVIHQYEGRKIAEKDFFIKDSAILDAIEYHTTGKPEMSALGKLIYAADKLEESRDFLGIDEIRRTIDEDFDKGFLMLLNRSVIYLENKGIRVDSLTRRTYEYYNI